MNRADTISPGEHAATVSSTGALVSVLLPVLNGERFLAAALDSVFRQDYRPLEVVVVDDGSTDGTANLVAEFGDRVRYAYQKSAGPSVARNAALQLAHGSVIAFLDADDIWLPQKLSRHMELLLLEPHLMFTVSLLRHFLEPGCELPAGLNPRLLDEDVPAWLPSTLVARREVFDVVGVFDPTLRMAEDMDWFSRAKDRGVASAILPELLVMKRVHDRNLSNNTGPNVPAVLRVIRDSILRKQNQMRGKVSDSE